MSDQLNDLLKKLQTEVFTLKNALIEAEAAQGEERTALLAHASALGGICEMRAKSINAQIGALSV